MSQLLSLIVILGLVTYRVSRFIILDTLIEGWRDAVHSWLLSKPRWWRLKLQYLLGCPFCVGIYVSAWIVVLTDLVTSVPLPVWAWLASASVALVVWEIIDPDAKPPIAKK